MTGSCIIDGVDIGQWGMFILRGGDFDFLSFPERKTPDYISWQEHDGWDVDLSEVYFKEKKLTVQFYLRADSGDNFRLRLESFYALLTSPGYRSLYSREFDRTFSLRFLSCPTYQHKGGMYKAGTKESRISVEFSMDNPLQLFQGTNKVPTGGVSTNSYVLIGDRDLREYGIIVREIYNTAMKIPALKTPLSRSVSNINGLVVYPSLKPTLEAKQITIECTMIADNKDVFYHNYEALFNMMREQGSLEVSIFGENIICFYSKMENFQKLHSLGFGVLVSFNLVLTSIEEMSNSVYILGTEDNQFAIATEDNQYLIRV